MWIAVLQGAPADEKREARAEAQLLLSFFVATTLLLSSTGRRAGFHAASAIELLHFLLAFCSCSMAAAVAVGAIVSRYYKNSPAFSLAPPPLPLPLRCSLSDWCAVSTAPVAVASMKRRDRPAGPPLHYNPIIANRTTS